MKRRVMIAKALSHEPDILFLDEPTAGVDVELRRDMWNLVRGLRARGVTIILTTHYIEEAEEMADRVGVINKGALVLVENKEALMKKFGKKQLTLHLEQPMARIPAELAAVGSGAQGRRPGTGVTVRRRPVQWIFPRCCCAWVISRSTIKDLQTQQSSLEDIFVKLVSERR